MLYVHIQEDSGTDSKKLVAKEQSVLKLCDHLTIEGRGEDLFGLLTTLRPFFSLIPKVKTSKLVMYVLDSVAKIPNTTDLQISQCKELVKWTRSNKHTLLSQRVEARLATLLMDRREYLEAQSLLSGLVKEATRSVDKSLLVQIYLSESKLHISLRNLPKAKAALNAAKSTVIETSFVSSAQQGTIDLYSGILHAEEKEYKTAYGYFFEAFEAFNTLRDARAADSLKYMLLCKIMVNDAHDVARIISSQGLRYSGPELDAMKAVADAYGKRSLKLFETTLWNFKTELDKDPIVDRHLSSLYDTLLDRNLCRLIEPFSRVEIAHIAELIDLPVDRVEKKLTQMILDKKFAGTLDEVGCVIIFDDPKTGRIYPAALEIIENMGKVCDSLLMRSAKLMS